uniref:HEAT repeat domain-containing protein n=1 Tax=Candidatus Caldatribacterium saccharofermentans TaxID=1454753 RepID=A0A7V4THT3_9BACT
MKVKSILQLLASDDELSRLKGIEEVQREPREVFVEVLVDLLQHDPSQIVREAALETLKCYPSSFLVPRLVPLLESDDIFVRNAAVTVLSAHFEAPLKELARLVNHPNKHVRKLALDALFQTRNPLAVDIIARGLQDPDVNNVIAAVEYLGKMEGFRFADAINDILERAEDPFLMCTCLEALARIGNRNSIAVVQRKFANPRDINCFVLFSYLRFLSEKGDLSFLPQIEAIFEEQGNIAGKELIDVLKGLISRHRKDFSDEDVQRVKTLLKKLLVSALPSSNRYELLVLLAEMGGEDVEKLLLAHLSHPNFFAKLGAIEGLAKLRTPGGIEKLREFAAREENQELREIAAEILRDLGAPLPAGGS